MPRYKSESSYFVPEHRDFINVEHGKLISDHMKKESENRKGKIYILLCS